jgi:hypothetical protein
VVAIVGGIRIRKTRRLVALFAVDGFDGQRWWAIPSGRPSSGGSTRNMRNFRCQRSKFPSWGQTTIQWNFPLIIEWCVAAAAARDNIAFKKGGQVGQLLLWENQLYLSQFDIAQHLHSLLSGLFNK